MYFANPGVLWFLLALLIPVIIHFFKFKKPIIVVFSQVKFIQNINIESKNKRRIKHLLLLLSRLLIVSFIILVFAEPRFNRSSESQTSVIFILDNSLSMGTEISDGFSPLNNSLSWIEAYVNRSSIGTNFKVFTLSDLSFNTGWKTKQQVLDRLTEIKSEHFTNGLSHVLSQIGNDVVSSSIFYFSDFQKGDFQLSLDSGLLSSNSHLYLVQQGLKLESNVFIDTVYLKNMYFTPGAENELFVTLKNDGIEGKGVNIRIIENDNLLAANSMKIDPQSKVDLNFYLDYERILDGKLKLELDDYPILFDNNFFISLTKFKPITIQYLYPVEPNIYLKTLFENSSFFDFTLSQIASVDYESLSSSNLIIIEGFDKIPEAFNNISTEVAIILIPPNSPELSSYSKFLGTSLEVKTDTNKWPLQFNSQASYIYEGLFEDNEVTGDFPNSRIVYVPERFSEALMSNNFKVPFLTRIASKRNLFFFSSPLSILYTNLPMHGIFLPIMYRLAQISQSNSTALYLHEEVADVSFKLADAEFTQITLSHNGQMFTPNYQVSDKKVVIKIDRDQWQPGHYDVFQGTLNLGSFSINIPKSESKMAFYDNRELTEWASGYKNIELIEHGQIDLQSKESMVIGGSNDLWKYALILALIFILTEIMILRFVK